MALTARTGGLAGEAGEITRVTARTPAAIQQPNSRPRAVGVWRSDQNPGWAAIFML